MTPTPTKSASQLDCVWDLLKMLPTDLTRKALVDYLEIEDILDFQLITESELDNLPVGTPKRAEERYGSFSYLGIIWPKQGKMGTLTGKTSPKKCFENFRALLCLIF